MRREDYRIILDAFIANERSYQAVYKALWGDANGSVMLQTEGLFSKIMELEKIVKKYSYYEEKHSDEEVDEFFNILESTELSLDEKVDRLYKG